MHTSRAGDLNAKQMLEYIGWLYGQKDSYRQSGLTAEEITRQRNSLRTKEVIGPIPDGECVGRLSYFDIYLPGERFLRLGLFEEIFP